MRPETIKTLQENTDTGHTNFFQDMSPRQGKQKQKQTIGTTSK